MADPSAPPLSLTLHLRLSLSLSPPPLCASCGRDPSPVHTGPSVPCDGALTGVTRSPLALIPCVCVHLFACHFLCACAHIFKSSAPLLLSVFPFPCVCACVCVHICLGSQISECVCMCAHVSMQKHTRHLLACFCIWEECVCVWGGVFA